MGKLKNSHDHVTKIIVTIFILNSRRPTVQMRPNLYCWTVPSSYLYYDDYDYNSAYYHGDDRIDAENTIMMSRKCNPDWHAAGTYNDQKMQTEHTSMVVNFGNRSAILHSLLIM